jgi:DNA-binding beta-propeller fold protein YncE
MLSRIVLTFVFAAAAFAGHHGNIVVADRGSGTLTVIDVETDRPTTVPMPPGLNKPEPMYVVSTQFPRRVFVGDRANNRVVVFDSKDFSVQKEISVGAGVFHMWASPQCRQLWVVNDLENTVRVIDTISLTVVAAIRMPIELGGRPHDVILDPTRPFAYVTVLGLPGPADYVLKYSTTTFAEVGRQQVGKSPHLSLSWANDMLYVPCQGSNQVFVLDRRNLTVLTTTAVDGAHGAEMSPLGRRFYTTNFTSTGENGLFTIDTSTNRVISVTHTPVGTPHNIVVTPFGTKLYVTHSGAALNQVSVYRTSLFDPTPRLLTTVTTGLTPFGLEYVP